MQIGTEFSIAIHILLCTEFFKNSHKITSDFISSGANINAATIRKIMTMLKAANLIDVIQGTGGIVLKRSPDDISLKDVYLAVAPVKNGELFKIHKGTAIACPIGGTIEKVLTPYFFASQHAMEESLAQQNLSLLLNDIKASNENA
ncbi:MAG: Rrf2 family transcriptional regulator [Spirochaetales bacterium]